MFVKVRAELNICHLKLLIMTLPLTIDVEFIEPASYVLHNAYKYVYLCDPIGEGDHRVGKIVKCPYSGMFYMQWDYVPHNDPLTKRSFDTYTECQCHVNKNVKDWWLQYHTPERIFDHEYH